MREGLQGAQRRFSRQRRQHRKRGSAPAGAAALARGKRPPQATQTPPHALVLGALCTGGVSVPCIAPGGSKARRSAQPKRTEVQACTKARVPAPSNASSAPLPRRLRNSRKVVPGRGGVLSCLEAPGAPPLPRRAAAPCCSTAFASGRRSATVAANQKAQRRLGLAGARARSPGATYSFMTSWSRRLPGEAE